jgi:beta-lactamase superfamily II metal-dependent hydrolase
MDLQSRLLTGNAKAPAGIPYRVRQKKEKTIMIRARLWPVALAALALVFAAGCAENETNPFDPSQDPDPPVVTGFAYSGGVATWTTNEPALCVLEYAPVGGDFRNYVYESTKEHSTAHSVTVLGMDDGGSYEFRLRSMDRAGNEAYDADVALPANAAGAAFGGPTMRLSMIDVGWGLSMAFESPGGAKVLIDSGADIHLDDVKTFLWDHGITYLDYAVATHYHADHIGGFMEDGGILDTFWVGDFIGPDTTYILDPLDLGLRNKLNARNIDIYTVKQGDDSTSRAILDWDDTPGFEVQVLSAGVGTQFAPSPEYIPADAEGNNDSVVFRFTFGDVSYVTMGDAEFFVERYIVDRYGRAGVRADLLQVAHHANDDGTSPFWLSNVDPRVGLISNAMIEAALEKEVVLMALRAADADYMVTDRIVPNTPRNVAPTYGDLIAVTDGETIEIVTEEHDW